jgi:DNA-binding NtrC family response regulator
MVTAAMITGAPACAVDPAGAVAALATSRVAVLLEGEVGTGKERCARALHAGSGRPGAFVTVRCSAIPAPLLEAALLGAGGDPGLLAGAERGTLFLDEVAALPRAVQRPLALALDRAADVRVVAATRHDLEPMLRDNRFHHDLYRAIAGARVVLPPLRARRAEIPGLVDEALAGCGARVDAAALALLTAYPWPGNLRQLNAVIAAAAAACPRGEIGVLDLPAYVRTSVPPRRSELAAPAPAAPPESDRLRFADAQARFEARYFGELLAAHGGNLSRVARVSGLSRATVRARARALGLLPDPRGRR